MSKKNNTNNNKPVEKDLESQIKDELQDNQLETNNKETETKQPEPEIVNKVQEDLSKPVEEKETKTISLSDLIKQASPEELAQVKNLLNVADPKEANKLKTIVKKVRVPKFDGAYVVEVGDEITKAVRHPDTGVIIDTVAKIPFVLSNGDKAELPTVEFYNLKSDLLEIVSEKRDKGEKPIGEYAIKTDDGDYTGKTGVSYQKYDILTERVVKTPEGEEIIIKYNTKI